MNIEPFVLPYFFLPTFVEGVTQVNVMVFPSQDDGAQQHVV